MGDMREVFDDMMQHNRARKAKNLASADPSGWTIHTKYHWSRDLNGKRLDYWPSKNKFQYDDRIMCGDVSGFIRKRSSIEDKEGI